MALADPAVLGRRFLLLGGTAAMTLPFMRWRGATASIIPPSGEIPFTVLRGDDPIGTHRLAFRQEGERLLVDVAADIRVKLGPVPVFRYIHRSSEVWTNGLLTALAAETDDNGKAYQVQARAVAGGVEVDGSEGRVMAPADIVPSSYWNSRILEQQQILDTMRGIVREVTIDRLGEDPVMVDGQTIPAHRYRVTGTRPMDVWYSDAGQFVGLHFEARGSQLSLRLEGGAPGAPNVAAVP